MFLQRNSVCNVLTLCLVMWLLVPTSLRAQSCPAPPPVNTTNLLGAWEGHYAFDGELYPLRVTIRKHEDGLVADGQLEQLNIPGSQFTTWLCASNELHLRLDLPDQRVVKMIGTPSDEAFSGRLVYYPSPDSPVQREVFALKKAARVK